MENLTQLITPQNGLFVGTLVIIILGFILYPSIRGDILKNVEPTLLNLVKEVENLITKSNMGATKKALVLQLFKQNVPMIERFFINDKEIESKIDKAHLQMTKDNKKNEE